MNKSVPLILNFKLFLVEKMRAMLWIDLRWDGALTGCPHPRGQFHVISGLGMLSCGLLYISVWTLLHFARHFSYWSADNVQLFCVLYNFEFTGMSPT